MHIRYTYLFIQIPKKETNPEFHWDVYTSNIPQIRFMASSHRRRHLRQRHRYRRWDQQSTISFAPLVLFIFFLQIFTAMRAIDALMHASLYLDVRTCEPEQYYR